MEGSSESIQEVAIEIPIQKEEKVFRNEAENSPPDMQAEPSEHEHEQDSPNVVEKKRRGGRTRFTIYQRAELEAAFTASRYLSPQQRLALAARLRVKPVAVQSWFKNRRFKWRKEVREGTQNPQALPAAPACLPFMYQPPCVYYSSGHVPVSQGCQGCFTGQPTNEPYSFAADFQVYPYTTR
ncbi:hypothetical protein OS493_016124 [Desmophyllum pertusum]|uniref:Homeobox domain-containing protein n=1 Tax=Desmophyllum pertusum TaxID=174260 RepID=A0A9X0A2W6_9CNID|nr:hypothetical protein OS493_016124 [Desmophyllum pertusum]